MGSWEKKKFTSLLGLASKGVALTLLFCSCSSEWGKSAPSPSTQSSFAPTIPANPTSMVSVTAPEPEPSETPGAAIEKGDDDEVMSSPTPSPTPDYQNLVAGIQVTPEVDLQQWKLLSDEDGIQAYQKKSDGTEGDVVAFRGETTMPTSLFRIATAINDNNLRKEWVDSYVDSHEIEDVSPAERVEYQHIKVPWPFHDRDFVYHAQVKVADHPKTMWIAMQSVVDSREPPQDDRVRGKIIYSYYYLKEMNEGASTKVVVEMAVDPSGSIPKWLVNLSQKKWPHNTLKSLAEIAQREDLVIMPSLADYFKQAIAKNDAENSGKKKKKPAGKLDKK